jgi:dihydroorotate dehydrogenase electron transfer subunit
MLAKKAIVKKILKENIQLTTLTLDLAFADAKPGQFVMVWLPGVDEKPMSIASNNPLKISVADAGPVSKKLCSLKEGDSLFVRGPLGKPFEPVGNSWLMVGGGYGFAPLRFMAEKGLKAGVHVESILGARSKDYLMQKAPGINHICTDDGSEGTKANVIGVLKPILEKKSFDCIYSCGPELMMKAVAEVAKEHNIRSQLSVERYMKCGIGICGHCAMNSWLSCIDGPTIDGEDALKYPDFGSCHCDQSGKKHDF